MRTRSVIESLLLRVTAEARIRARFENLVPGSFEQTSDLTGQYNCVAHAAHDCGLNWWPIPGGSAEKDRHWPREVPARRTLSAFVQALQTKGYEPCEDGSLEPDYERVVLFVSDNVTIEETLNAPTHVARQLPCGKWTSKLGADIDIVHDTPERLVGETYGRVEMYLKRRRGMPITKLERVET